VTTRPVRSPAAIKEFGDFQTPTELAGEVCRLLVSLGLKPKAVLEPTCGTGSFLRRSFDDFPSVQTAVGLEIEPSYLETAAARLGAELSQGRLRLVQGDFFSTDWQSVLSQLPDPILIIGNPPWVTNAAIGVLGGSNLPTKRNPGMLRGLEALTGKSNFDISEWMLLRCAEWVLKRTGTLAVLCKTAVARRLLPSLWSTARNHFFSTVYRIDAKRHFNAATSACLLVVSSELPASGAECPVFPSVSAPSPVGCFGVCDDILVADVAAYRSLQRLRSRSQRSQWRSGVKHDAAAILELQPCGDLFVNGLGETVALEPDYLYPLLKSSELAGRDAPTPTRFVLVTQKSVADETRSIERLAPLTWAYLSRHAEALDGRASRIYRGRPQFAVFGVGEYAFSPWKVAVSGLYANLRFWPVGPVRGRPVLFDDTCYFLSCREEAHARSLAEALNGPDAQTFLRALMFPDSKRPVTSELLGRLDLVSLVPIDGAAQSLATGAADPSTGATGRQIPLFG